MLFNSLDFAIFLPTVFVCYWFVANKSKSNQNLVIVIASYIFYGWWDWKFLSLILISTLVDYFVGRGLGSSQSANRRNALLVLSLLVNIGFLAFFKYYNFFLENFIEAFSLFGHRLRADSLNIILPVGISFYTFQTLSYTIDVHRGKFKPTNDILAFCAFVCFFPQLVAGPIERATNLLPQFYQARTFDYSKAIDGLRQVLWGLFKKIVIADRCAEYVDLIFNNSSDYSGSTLLLGVFFFAFQIYGDFSGYSDIAIGTARLFGVDLRQNFAFPYFSRDIAEFWRRWHISLSTWFKDYLYIPLGGSRGSTALKIRNTFAIFIISGFWHGASWNFIVWGGLNALFFLPLLLTNRNRNHLGVVAAGKLFPTGKEMLSIAATFSLTLLAWIFFRADNIQHAFSILTGIFSNQFFSIPEIFPTYTLLMILFFLVIEWIGRENSYGIEKIGLLKSTMLRRSFYYFLILLIFWVGASKQQFIYFQF